MVQLGNDEHDYVEFKGGQIFEDRGSLLGSLAKQVSAFANSGGGVIVLGVDNDRNVDGVPALQGRTSTREWLEQTIPTLVVYTLREYRVHQVARDAAASRIPANRHLIVVEIGDSPLAPHQCDKDGGQARRGMYYYRQGSNSVPAPHFHLELLRQRRTAPVLSVDLVSIRPNSCGRFDDRSGAFLLMSFEFRVENTGRNTARLWDVAVESRASFNVFSVSAMDFRQLKTMANVGFDWISSLEPLLPGQKRTVIRPMSICVEKESVSAVEFRMAILHGASTIDLHYSVAVDDVPLATYPITLMRSWHLTEVNQFLASFL